MSKNTWLSILIITFTVSNATAAKADIVIIGHPSNTNVLTPEQVTNLFLGKLRSYPDGTAAKPIDQNSTTESRHEFREKFLKKNETALGVYWSTLVFTGNGSKPPQLPNDDEVKKTIAQTPNAVGYINTKSVDSSVKVLLEQK